MLLNEVLNEGWIPNEWKERRGVLVHKGGSKKELRNYRPVAIINVMCKLFMMVIINELVEESGILGDIQGVFRRKLHFCISEGGGLQTTQPTSGGADPSCCANCVEPSRPQQWGSDLSFFGHAGIRQAHYTDTWTCHLHRESRLTQT